MKRVKWEVVFQSPKPRRIGSVVCHVSLIRSTRVGYKKVGSVMLLRQLNLFLVWTALVHTVAVTVLKASICHLTESVEKYFGSHKHFKSFCLLLV